MTRWQKRASAISFSAHNLMLDRPEYDAWDVLRWTAAAYDKRGFWSQDAIEAKREDRAEAVRDMLRAAEALVRINARG